MNELNVQFYISNWSMADRALSFFSVGQLVLLETCKPIRFMIASVARKTFLAVNPHVNFQAADKLVTDRTLSSFFMSCSMILKIPFHVRFVVTKFALEFFFSVDLSFMLLDI